MNFAFGGPPVPKQQTMAPPRPRLPGSIDMSLGPAAKGAADLTPMSAHDIEAAGADWRNALSRWVAAHAYYPPQARRDGEEGDAKVHILMEPGGKVKSVELVGKSGSVWLDLALLSLFRDQTLPRLPPSETHPFDFDFTMHFRLIRVQ
jgi:TonB family protein